MDRPSQAPGLCGTQKQQLEMSLLPARCTSVTWGLSQKLILAKPSPQFLGDFDAERTSQGSLPRPPSRRWGSSGPKARSPHSVLKEPFGGGNEARLGLQRHLGSSRAKSFLQQRCLQPHQAQRSSTTETFTLKSLLGERRSQELPILARVLQAPCT